MCTLLATGYKDPPIVIMQCLKITNLQDGGLDAERSRQAAAIMEEGVKT